MTIFVRTACVVFLLVASAAVAQTPDPAAIPPAPVSGEQPAATASTPEPVAADAGAAPVAEPTAPSPAPEKPASQSLIDAALNRMSLMFTEEEIEAVKSGKTEELPTDVAPVDESVQEEVVEPQYDPANPPPPIPLDRKIALGGILYRAEGDWIIWLNGQKLGPDNLLPEIRGITVANDKVYLEWFDIGINGIIRLTLRPHQTYDIVTGLLLPGKAG